MPLLLLDILRGRKEWEEGEEGERRLAYQIDREMDKEESGDKIEIANVQAVLKEIC